MIFPEKLLEEIRLQGRYRENAPVSRETITEIKDKFPGISKQFIAFLERFGIDEEPGFRDYELPCLLTEQLSAAGYYPYDETTVFDFEDNPKGWSYPPETVVVFAHSGASWFYCFLGDGSDDVYTFDYAGNIFVSNDEDFFTHLLGSIDTSSEDTDEGSGDELEQQH
ncbi:hypothetical protein [Roseibium sp. MMSF_3412]|uniref:hypothetical protein n=1 Tax=Roseibium sp. MMSF_3412 TaxID=3046712 RepID=UPI00273D2C36|nr:hypothetical protein [Roseibium sp. MMSF_3412]